MTFNLHLIYNFQGVTGHGYYAISGSLLVLGSVCGMAASDWLEAKLMKKKNGGKFESEVEDKMLPENGTTEENLRHDEVAVIFNT